MRQLTAISFARWDLEKMATGRPIKMTGTISQKKVANIPANVRAKQVRLRMIRKAFDAMKYISCRLLRDRQINGNFALRFFQFFPVNPARTLMLLWGMRGTRAEQDLLKTVCILFRFLAIFY